MMSKDDPCDLFRVARAYYDRHRMSDADLFLCLKQFCRQHPEVMESECYESGMSWTPLVRRELKHILWSFSNYELKQRPIFVKAERFLDTVPLYSTEGEYL